jgi:UDP-N-acetylmuramate: L-alanyl-gamma-D-glutamyl-meso-diaminopimelate ligase
MKSVFRTGFKNGITNNIPLIKKIHFISIGGRIMHTLAIVLQEKGFQVTGSDDEIYDPSLSRLREKGLAPEKMGWYPEKVDSVDAVILGMHARVDNPELIRAQELNLPIYSFPSFVQELSKEKKQIVVTGSHGKTTTTAMIMHVLSDHQIDFDYLVGASIRGFDQMVQLTKAPLILIEGDEYLSSPIDRSPKFSHFHPDIAVMTGIAWDHINVFPTEEAYVQLFRDFASQLKPSASLIYYEGDDRVKEIGGQVENSIAYKELSRSGLEEVQYEGDSYPIQVIGSHNLQNMAAALEVCQQLGISKQDFFTSIAELFRSRQTSGSREQGKRFYRFF